MTLRPEFFRLVSYPSSGHQAYQFPVVLLVFASCVSAAVVPEPALQIFLGTTPDTLLRNLKVNRPPALNEQAKAQVIRCLPRDGEVTKLSDSERKKLASLEPVLRLHGRDAVYVVKVVEVPAAVIALHERSVLLISASGLALWNAQELQALAAHEIAHEYTWEQYQLARSRKESPAMQQLELYSDGIAILTLAQIGVDPSALTSALKKGIRYNRSHLGFARNEDQYPDFKRRQRFHRAIIEWMSVSSTKRNESEQVVSRSAWQASAH
ncbi:MAG TPA: hypothetical protein VLJ11_17175 [Bryobacteraceae bacterium]|nr:hypothetical protein [Bryobacteraceae bacterium]